MRLAEIKCANCGSSLEDTNMDFTHKIAKCAHCDSVFSLVEDQPSADATRSHQDDEVPMPEKFQLEHSGEGMSLSWSWFSPVAFFLLFFSTGWFGVLFSMVSIASQIDAVPMLIPLAFFALVGVGLVYSSFAWMLNHTTIKVDPGWLAIHHGPIPWSAGKMIQSSNIRQIYCKEIVHKNDKGSTTSYEVHAVLSDSGKDLKIVGMLQDQSAAKYLEQQIEKFLRIKNVHVPGER